MEIPRIRLLAKASAVSSAACLILGLILLCKGLPLPGVILALVGLSVLMISASILRFLSLVDNPWMTKYRKRCGKRC